MPIRNIKTYGPVTKLPMCINAGRGKKKLLHIGVHNSANRNAGDTLLFPVVRKAFDTVIGPFEWTLRQAWEELSLDDIDSINQEFDGIVIGGGGLLLRDQAGSDVSNSGWQWNCSVGALKAINIPIYVFAIGYNRFRGQEDFDPIFTEHIQTLAEKSTFLGLRNHGSIKALEKYLDGPAHLKLKHQFCPTTVIWQLYPEYRALAEAHDAKKEKVLAFNAAFDRAALRFGDDPDKTLSEIAKAVSVAEQRGWHIVLAAHKTMDRDIEPYLDAAGVQYDVADLTDASPNQIMEFYAQVDFVFGMRGHAQLIPLGLRRPIMSIISHDKVRFLLEDIGQSNWGIEVNSEKMVEKLIDMLSIFENYRATVLDNIAIVQQAIWEKTLENMTFIESKTNYPCS
ncbi:polysaccharide pyruvyl transferase family protein [Marinobacterium sp. YM272]|uniref:polysaccharide pyruvyl transferase family protein n=1 Tax=Marinobacterium sp. YM272 TaxID=3421654 RepID=UPI003D7F9CC8